MNSIIYLNQVIAKKLLINMLEKDGSKIEMSFDQLLVAKFIQDLFNCLV